MALTLPVDRTAVVGIHELKVGAGGIGGALS